MAAGQETILLHELSSQPPYGLVLNIGSVEVINFFPFVEEEMLMRKFYELMSAQGPCKKARLTKLPRSLLDKTSTIKNTEQVLEQLPQVISALDAHMDSGLQSVPHLETVIQLLANMESCQLKPLSKAQFSREGADQPPDAG
ncbi:hypothetical protein RJ639_008696 [Escallonia herrerae]|uniref:Uncharacterized protein n=1 Tax=Escallonia herrerae TaxID=1293975 RepID=A0AA88VZ49_9ASTE|nr:hypothetical protein RJ639_008696 [Escallonia herrerae]